METLKILRWKDGEIAEVEDGIAQEAFLHLSIDERIKFDVVITPEKIRPFALGHLVAEGFISSLAEVRQYSEKLDDEPIYVDLELENSLPAKSQRSYNIIWTECGGVPLAFFTFLSKPERIETSLRVAGERLIQIPVLIKDQLDGFKETGAYHYAFLFDEDLEIRQMAKDIGRHNAVDKVIGEELLGGGSFDDKVLFVTGRITADIMMKCLRCRIPLTISKGAPLAGAIRLARDSGLGLIGFLRGRRFNIYSGSEMIARSPRESNLT